MRSFLRTVKDVTLTYALRPFARMGLYKRFMPAKGHLWFGDLDRVTPLSKVFGYDRGGPLDRYYIESFLAKNASLIKGRVLEIGDNDYTVKFGGSKVEKSNILYIDDSNPKATIIADLSDASNINDDLFDCLVLTQTLHMIYDFKAVIRNCYRILKPGGSLLMTVPGISHIDPSEWNDYWYWSFTHKAVSTMLNEVFPPENVKVQHFGNVKVAAGFLYGVGLPEMKRSDMEYHDPSYQVTIAAVATKAINATR